MLGREVATPLSIEFWARNHAALEHLDVVVGHGRSGVPLENNALVIAYGKYVVFKIERA